MQAVLGTITALVTGALLLAASLLVSDAIARRLTPARETSVRLPAILAVEASLLTASFHVLALAGLFAPLPALAIFSGLLFLFRREVDLALFTDLADRASVSWRELPAAVRLVAVLVGVLLGVRLLHGALAPPLGWDSLTYHDVEIARWVATGGFSPELVPDSLDGWEYFPHGGEVLHAWAALPFHSDAPLGPFGALPWLTVLGGMYALARELGGSRARSALLALVLASNPSVLAFVTSGYIDNVTLAGTLLGALFAARVLRGAPASEAVLSASGFALAAAAKMTALPALFLALGVLAAAVWRRPGGAGAVAGSLAVACLAAPTYVRAWVETGSPIYPIPLVVLGRVVFAGNETTTLGQAGLLVPTGPFSWPPFLAQLLGLGFDGRDLLNPGFAAPAALLLGVAGFVLLARRRPAAAAFFGVVALVPLAGFVGAGTVALRVRWAFTIGRFFTSTLALALAPAALVVFPLADPILACVATVQVALGVPRGICREEIPALLALGALLSAVGLLAGAARRGRGRGRAALAAAVVVGVATVVVWTRARDRLRYPVWAAAVSGRAFDLHQLNPWSVSAWPIWEAVDGPAPQRIAAAAGWNGIGDNWYRYPLFGSRWQNQVLYVPITASGAIVGYRRPAVAIQRADLHAWLSRLVSERVDVLVAMAPPPLERTWAEALPVLFRPLARSAEGANAAWRVDRQAVRGWLATRTGRPSSPVEISSRP